MSEGVQGTRCLRTMAEPGDMTGEKGATRALPRSARAGRPATTSCVREASGAWKERAGAAGAWGPTCGKWAGAQVCGLGHPRGQAPLGEACGCWGPPRPWRCPLRGAQAARCLPPTSPCGFGKGPSPTPGALMPRGRGDLPPAGLLPRGSPTGAGEERTRSRYSSASSFPGSPRPPRALTAAAPAPGTPQRPPSPSSPS